MNTMPVEIRELIIRARLDDSGASQPSNANGQDQAALIEACVDQVLAILKERSER